MAKKIELLHTTYDESGNIESQEVVHPLTSPDCIIMENGKTLDEVMGDGIATPTLTHEGTSFKVGVGDSNIEVVEGDVAGMTLKGQSYQNILPKPTTLIMETDEQEFKINDKIDSNIIIDDNIAEIATVKGKTIVNAVQEESGSEYTVLGQEVSGQGEIVVSDVRPNSVYGRTLTNLNTGEKTKTLISTTGTGASRTYACNIVNKIPSGTKITFKLKTNTAGITGNLKAHLRVDRNTASSSDHYPILRNYKTYQNGAYDVNLCMTAPIDIDAISIYIDENNGTIDVSDVIILVGDYTSLEIPYFEGTKHFDANLKGVTLQGQTLVNAIQEPCKDNYVVLGADDGIEISAETGGCGTIENTVQGGINGVVLEGMTLVNLFNTKNLEQGTVESTSSIAGYDVTSGTVHYLTNLDRTEPYNYSYICTQNLGTGGCAIFDLKPNTAYTVKWFYEKINDVNPTQTYMRVGLSKNEWGSFNESYLSINPSIQDCQCVFTTPNEFPSDMTKSLALSIFNVSNTIEYKVRYVILEGDYTNIDIPYFEGMASVKQPVLTTTGKNLYNIDKHLYPVSHSADLTYQYETNSIIVNGTSTGEVSTSRMIDITHLLKNGNTYTISMHNSIFNGLNFRTYNTDGTQTYNTTIRYDEAYHSQVTVYIQLAKSDKTYTFNNEEIFLQIEEGSVATSYEPYQSSTVTTEKNLFDGILAHDYLTDATGQPSGKGNVADNPHCYTPSFIPIQAKEKFRLKATSNGSTSVGDGKVYFYDKDYNYLNIHITSLEAHMGAFSMDVINTVPNNSNIAYMRVRFYNGLGVQADSVEISKVIELRGIGNVKDELDLTTGKLTQRIGGIVLDGSEDWKILESYTNEYRINFVLNRGEIPSNCKFICNQYMTMTLRQDDMLTDYMYVGNLNINIFTKPNITLDEFKLQLQSNPLILQYPLATPIIKTIDLQVTDQDGNTIPHIQAQPTITHITASSDYLIPTVTIDNLAYDTIIKPSTLYTIRFKHDTVNVDNPLTVDLGGTVQVVTSTEFTITTPSELTHNQLVFSGKNNVVSEVQVIEGDVTNIEYPFFEGMNDVKFSDSKFVSRSKNIWQWGDLLDVGVAQLTVDLEPGEYWFSCNSSITYDSRPVIVFFDENLAQITYWYADEASHYILPVKTRMIYLYSNGYSYQDSNTNLTSFTNIMLTKESHVKTDYEPCKGVVEVQQDVDSIPLTSDMFEQGYYVQSNSIEKMLLQQIPKDNNTEIRIMNKSLVKVKPSTKYILNNDSVFMWALEFDKNGAYLGTRIGTDDTLKNYINTNTYTEYVGIVLLYSVAEENITPSDLDSMNLILQEVPQEIVLRGIGDVKDELDLTRGEYIQRIGEMVLDGSEAWTINTNFSSTYTVFYTTINGVYDSTISSTFVTDKFNNIKTASELGTVMGFYIGKAGDNKIAPFISSDKTTTEELRQWLKTNPVKVQYKLAVPIIHKVNLTNTKVIPSYATETHYETITPSDSLIPNITIPSTLNYDVAIKPSTEYTIRANTSDNLTVDLGGAIGILSNGKVTLTTPATLTHNEVKFSGTGKVKELMVVEGNEIKDNVPFFNGMKDVEMGGIKLVNIARGATCSRLVTANTNKTQFTYTSDGAANAYHTIYFDCSLLKTNTVYTVFADITTNTSDASHPIKFQFGYTSGNLLDVRKGFVGKIKQTITSANTTKDGLAMVFRPCSSGGKVVIENPMIIEGDWTHLDEIPFIESEMIIEQPIIRSQGKNLLDLSQFETATDEGKEVVYIGDYIPNIKFKENTQYTVKFTSKYKDGYATKVKIKHTDGSEIETSFSSTTFTENRIVSTQHKTVQYIQFWQNVNNSELSCGVYVKNETWIEEGSVETSYEPYKHQTLYSNRVIGYEENCYYQYGTGKKAEHAEFNSVIADVEGLSVAYMSNAHSNFTFWDKDGVFISGKPFVDTNNLNTDNVNGLITIPTNAKYMKFACYNNSVSKNPNYTKATVTGELPLRSLPSGVCDTLNLVTGEYVQRVGEFECNDTTIDGEIGSQLVENAYSVVFYPKLIFGYDVDFDYDNTKINAERIQCVYPHFDKQDCGMYVNYNNIVLWDKTVSSIQEFKDKYWGMKVQCQISTPIVRKLGFTTKGNYTETALNLNGWVYNDTVGKTIRFRTDSAIHNAINTSPIITNDYHVRKYGLEAHGDFEYITNIDHTIYVSVDKDKLDTSDIAGFIQWLSQNPIKVGYITSAQSSDSYSNIHKPIFFNNVNVQYLPNNVDIQPQLTFQARTRNSYVMDMMKPNVTYTMKASSYDANTRIWMANTNANTSVMSNKTFQFADITLNDSQKQLIIVGNWYEPMIIEGDVTGKNLPYFKGILSSYHDVDEIEVYSVNKNLFDIKGSVNEQYDFMLNVLVKGGKNYIKDNVIYCVDDAQNNYGSGQKIKCKPNTKYYISFHVENLARVGIHLSNKANAVTNADSTFSYTTPNDCHEFLIAFYRNGGENNGTHIIRNLQIEESSTSTSYIPHVHNTTLIEMPTRLETVKVVRPQMEEGVINSGNGQDAEVIGYVRTNYIPVQPSEFIHVRNGVDNRLANIMCYDINKNFICFLTGKVIYNGYVPENCYFVRIYMSKTNTSDLTMTRMAYKPIQLNSLPNGVCDEIIMKPNSNKAQLVQRVGKVVLDGSEVIAMDSVVIAAGYTLNEISTYFKVMPTSFTLQKSPTSYDGQPNMLCDSLVVTSRKESQQTILKSICPYDDGFGMRPKNDVNNVLSLQTYLQQNPLTVYYELATPIIHEIQLKGYPYVYENGTVTLNTDIPHQTFVSYNVNQEQLISTQNETIIRHDQQIDDLYYYIEMYLEEIYQMELFRMKLELSL